jgi:signal transduction histidine kinase
MFLLDASHELGTPITVALGHAELIEQSSTDKEVTEDARVVVGELGRLRTLAARLLLLASAGSPGFLDLGPVAADSVIMEALDRWGYTPRRWRLGEVADATVQGDRDRLAVALDALIENAIAHTAPDDLIELSARVEEGGVVLAVADSGCGIPEEDLERIFGRFSRATPYRSREVGGFGLGLPTVRAIAEAHRGSVRVHSTVGKGATFELVIPAAPVPDRAMGQVAMNLPGSRSSLHARRPAAACRSSRTRRPGRRGTVRSCSAVPQVCFRTPATRSCRGCARPLGLRGPGRPGRAGSCARPAG